jgi:hypothetical protein
VRAGEVEPARRYAPPPPSRGNVWQVVAIIAIVAATAGWTTVAVLALRDTSVAQAVPSVTEPPLGSDEPSLPPLADTHDAPELEAFLPPELDGTALEVQSWTGDSILTDDGWSTSITAFLTSAGKTATDLQVAQAFDATQVLDGSIGVYRVDGVDAIALRDALLAAWRSDYPDLNVSQVTLDGTEVTKGDFGQDSVASYLYIRDDLVYDIETTDETIATAAIAVLLDLGATPSAAPAASPSPS